MVNSGIIKKTVIAGFLGICVLISACTMLLRENANETRFDWNSNIFVHNLNYLGDTYSFIVMADTHIGDENDGSKFSKIKEKLTAEDAFIVVAGDVTRNGARGEIEIFLEKTVEIGLPSFPVIGNHDIYLERGKAWKELIGPAVYRIDVDSTSLFILDNAEATFGYEQFEWFEREIKSARKNTFVFAHENFFIENSPPDGDQITDIRERARVISLLEGRCNVVFTGHIHKHFITRAGTIDFVSLGYFGGASTGSGEFCRVYVSNDGIRYEFDNI